VLGGLWLGGEDDSPAIREELGILVIDEAASELGRILALGRRFRSTRNNCLNSKGLWSESSS
jgi:hypothetical protein